MQHQGGKSLDPGAGTVRRSDQDTRLPVVADLVSAAARLTSIAFRLLSIAFRLILSMLVAKGIVAMATLPFPAGDQDDPRAPLTSAISADALGGFDSARELASAAGFEIVVPEIPGHIAVNVHLTAEAPGFVLRAEGVHDQVLVVRYEGIPDIVERSDERGSGPDTVLLQQTTVKRPPIVEDFRRPVAGTEVLTRYGDEETQAGWYERGCHTSFMLTFAPHVLSTADVNAVVRDADVRCGY